MSPFTAALLLGSSAALAAASLTWSRNRLRALGYAALAVVLAALIHPLLTLPVLAAGGLLVWHRCTHTAATVTRWGARSRRKHGVASTLDIARHASWVAMRRKATTVRPSLAERSRRARLRVPTHQVAVPLCRTGLLRVWVSVEDVVLTFGRPRIGKTGWLMGRVIDAPGAVLVTSTRTDIYDTTAALRAQLDRPVFVFNPTGLGGIPSTVGFDPLCGCADPATAAERAADLLAGGSHRGQGDREFWEGQARRVLTALLHAAALGKLSMHAVAGWVANPDAAQRPVLGLLRRSSSAAAYVPDAEQFLTTNDKTRSSITSTIMPCLGWLANPTATAATTGAVFDVAALLRARGTVYLLGAQESQVAPLVAAFTGHVAREARRIAALAPAGRLDPPLALVLDEAALICPVPLDSWTSDMGGRGVHIIAAFQSRAQLISRWGEAAARVILNNAGAVMLFGYGADTDDLTHWSRLAGERDEVITTHDPAGRVVSRSTHKVPVIAPTQLTNLPPGRVVVFRRGMPVVTGRAAMAWKRRDVRAQTKLVRRVARTVVADATAAAQSARPVGRPSPTSPVPGAQGSTVPPIPAQSAVMGGSGASHALNGARPAGGPITQRAPDATH